MKTNKLFTLVILLGFLGVVATSCKKKEGCTDPTAINYDADAKKNCCCEYAPAPAADIATQITGNYIGSGNSSTGAPFVNQVIKVSKVTNTRVKIEPVGNTYITAFEVNIMQVSTAVTSDANEDNDFAVQMGSSPYTIAFSTYSPNPADQDFGGMKQ